MTKLVDVPNVPQTTAGGANPQFDCAEECAVSLAKRFMSVPGVRQFSVRQAELWSAAHGDNPNDGTSVETLAALLNYYGLPSRKAKQPLNDAPDRRRHYCVGLVRANKQGLPQPNGTHGHFVAYLGDGWYRNPANGKRTNSPPVAPAYKGVCVEVDISAVVTGGEEPMTTAEKHDICTALVDVWYEAYLRREPTVDERTAWGDEMVRAGVTATLDRMKATAGPGPKNTKR